MSDETSRQPDVAEVTLPEQVAEGKDELNLAEFPLSAIADRVQTDQKTMVFEDKIWDVQRGEMLTRQLTITASDHYGLPTALDDEVILGLVQLSKLQNFDDRRVHFTRYQLIQLLGWRNESKSYERLEKALNRWVGVTLYYKNAWWSREEKCWVDEKFHILDNVTLFDRKNPHRRRRPTPEQESLPFSSFVWNDVIFRSFRAGNLKSIDFDFFVRLDGPIAKRLYRFLDKRFYHRDRWEFDLKEFSFEHVGLARTYDAANLKRKLRPPIRELETAGFLRPMTYEERFRKVRAGEWRVCFEKAGAKPLLDIPDASVRKNLGAVFEALLSRGITRTVAGELVKAYPADRITAQLEVFDWLLERKDPKVSRNPSGFLVTSIKSEYATPKGFVSQEEQKRRAKDVEQRKRKAEERERKQREAEEMRQQAREQAISNFWSALSPEERTRMENEALAKASNFQREAMERGGPFGKAARKGLLDEYAVGVMAQG